MVGSQHQESFWLPNAVLFDRLFLAIVMFALIVLDCRQFVWHRSVFPDASGQFAGACSAASVGPA